MNLITKYTKENLQVIYFYKSSFVKVWLLLGLYWNINRSDIMENASLSRFCYKNIMMGEKNWNKITIVKAKVSTFKIIFANISSGVLDYELWKMLALLRKILRYSGKKGISDRKLKGNY